MTSIALIGYGKMGQIIERLAKEKGHEIKVIIDPNNENTEKEINENTLKDVDVCIDFTHPDVIIDNIKKIAELKKNIVVGTTGWYDKMDEVKEIVKQNNIGLIWSGNFSIGVNAFFRIIENASKVFNNLDDYNVSITETHHIHKADKPSGTAKMTGDIIVNAIDRKNSMAEVDTEPKQDQIGITSVREGEVKGTHTVEFDGPNDIINITHNAKNREGFASGAIMAAEFIKDKTGFHDINDLMKNILG